MVVGTYTEPSEQVAEIQAFIASRLNKLGLSKAELSRTTDRSYELILNILRGEQKNGGSVLVLLEMLRVIGCELEIREAVQ
jgi:lambda repressor-like predicted transcriptional regulator